MAGLNALLGKGGSGVPVTDQANATAPNSTPEQPAATDQDSVNRAATNLGSTTAESKVDADGFSDFSGLTKPESDNGNREPIMIVTSAPIQRFKIGRFQFERAVLNLFEREDADEFRKLVSKLPAADRNQLKIIDREAAEQMVRPIEPGATKQFDSSVGRQREVLGTGDKVIGDDPLDARVGGQGEQFAKVAQMDNNAPVAGTEPKHVVNQVNRGDVDKTAEDRAKQDEKNSGDNV